MHLKINGNEDNHSLQSSHSVSSSPPTSDADTQPSPQPKSITTFPLVIFNGPKSDVVKQGYLGRQDHNHLQYFVLRAESQTGPSRLEWYENRETFVRTQSDNEAVLFGSSKQGLIYLSRCLFVSRMGSAKTGCKVALYSKELKLILAMEDTLEQNDWYLSIRNMMELEQKQKKEEQKKKVDQEKMLKVEKVEMEQEEVEDDEGYWTLPPAAFFREVWAVTVKPTDLGCCGLLAGESHLCLTASSLLLVHLNTSSYTAPVDFPLLSVRSFGHTASSFYLELGRSAPHGPGHIWMELKDNGNATQLHEKVRAAVRELRALPDFGRSPPCGGQKRSALKSYRRKYSKKHSNPKSPPPGLSETPRGLYTSPSPKSSTSLGTPSCRSQTSDDYMEMRRAWPPAIERVRWDNSQDESSYMVMSPQPRYSLPVNRSEDYTAMKSQDEEWSASPSHNAPMNSKLFGSPRSTSTCLTPSQSEIRSCSSLRQWFTFRRRIRCRPVSDVRFQSLTTRPDQASSTTSSGCFSRRRAAADCPVRRSPLSFFCLPFSLWGRKK